MDLDGFAVIEILQSHDSLNEEGLGILEVEMEEGPFKVMSSRAVQRRSGVFSYIIANPVYTPFTPFDTSPRS